MISGWAAFAAALIANAVLTAFLGLRIWRQTHVPGRRTFSATMGALSIWAGAYAGETLAPTVAAKAAWLLVENLGIVTLVPFFFLFALRYTGGSRSTVLRAGARRGTPPCIPPQPTPAQWLALRA